MKKGAFEAPQTTLRRALHDSRFCSNFKCPDFQNQMSRYIRCADAGDGLSRKRERVLVTKPAFYRVVIGRVSSARPSPWGAMTPSMRARKGWTSTLSRSVRRRPGMTPGPWAMNRACISGA